MIVYNQEDYKISNIMYLDGSLYKDLAKNILFIRIGRAKTFRALCHFAERLFN